MLHRSLVPLTIINLKKQCPSQDFGSMMLIGLQAEEMKPGK